MFILKREKCRKTHDNQPRAGKKQGKKTKYKRLVLSVNPHFSLQMLKTRSRSEFKEKCSPPIAKVPETMSDLIVGLLSNQWFLWLVTHWQHNQINVFIPSVSPDALEEWKSGKKLHWVTQIPCIQIEGVIWFAYLQGLKGLFDNRRANKRNPSHV